MDIIIESYVNERDRRRRAYVESRPGLVHLTDAQTKKIRSLKGEMVKRTELDGTSRKIISQLNLSEEIARVDVVKLAFTFGMLNPARQRYRMKENATMEAFVRSVAASFEGELDELDYDHPTYFLQACGRLLTRYFDELPASFGRLLALRRHLFVMLSYEEYRRLLVAHHEALLAAFEPEKGDLLASYTWLEQLLVRAPLVRPMTRNDAKMLYDELAQRSYVSEGVRGVVELCCHPGLIGMSVKMVFFIVLKKHKLVYLKRRRRSGRLGCICVRNTPTDTRFDRVYQFINFIRSQMKLYLDWMLDSLEHVDVDMGFVHANRALLDDGEALQRFVLEFITVIVY